MKKLLVAAILLTTSAHAAPLKPGELMMCKDVDYALCASSSAKPVPGKTITIYDKKFRVGVAECPLIHGDAVGNRSLQNGTCTPDEKNTIWSMFGTPTGGYPTWPDWKGTVPADRFYAYDPKVPTTGESNGWGMKCYDRHVVNGVVLYNCPSPLNESPWTNSRIIPSAKTYIGTQNPGGADAVYPIGGPVPEGLTEADGK